MNEITLKLNLSPGDIPYAKLTVPALIEAHRERVNKVLAVVDLCRPKSTLIVDADKRFPIPDFERKAQIIQNMALEMKYSGLFDDVFFLRPNASFINHLSEKYLRGIVRETHDYGGCANMSYWAALELPETRFVLHYDADILLYQKSNYDWAHHASKIIDEFPDAVAATPRTSPPFAFHLKMEDGPTVHEGRPRSKIKGGWRNDWFSTRCFLIDRDKLKNYLPLLKGKVMLDTVFRKIIRRGYPRSPEIILFRRLGSAGAWRLNMETENAWLLHPSNKPDRYLDLLPTIIKTVRNGDVPAEQRGYSEVNLLAWEKFLTPQFISSESKLQSI